MKLRQVLLMVIVALYVFGCAATYNDPYEGITRALFFNRVKTVAMEPLETYVGVEIPDSVKNVYESMIMDSLTQVGFKVIPPSIYQETWAALQDSGKGFFDEKTGKKDTARFNKLQRECKAIVAEEYEVDVFLRSYVQRISVKWAGGTASWHGTKQKIKSTGAQVLEALGGVSTSGKVPVMSLAVIFMEPNNNVLYSKYGGIQLLHTRGGFPEDWIPLPEDEYLCDSERNAIAVGIALEEVLHFEKYNKGIMGK